jgi:hypothetical protein
MPSLVAARCTPGVLSISGEVVPGQRSVLSSLLAWVRVGHSGVPPVLTGSAFLRTWSLGGRHTSPLSGWASPVAKTFR